MGRRGATLKATTTDHTRSRANVVSSECPKPSHQPRTPVPELMPVNLVSLLRRRMTDHGTCLTAVSSLYLGVTLARISRTRVSLSLTCATAWCCRGESWRRSAWTSGRRKPSNPPSALALPTPSPSSFRLADLEVRIPRLEILALERPADRDGKSVDAVLARELLDVVSARSEYLATTTQGLTAALPVTPIGCAATT